MRRRVLAAILLAGRALGAQATAQLDVEAATIRAAGFARSGGVSIAPAARLDVPFFTFAGDGALAVYAVERYTGRVAGQTAAHATFRALTLEGGVSAAHLAFRQEAEDVGTSTLAIIAPDARSQSELEAYGRADLSVGPWSLWGSGGRKTLRVGPTRRSWDRETGIQWAFQRAITSLSVHSAEYRTVRTVNGYVPAYVLSSFSNSFVAPYPDFRRRWQNDLLTSTTVLAGRGEVSVDGGLRITRWRALEQWASVYASWRIDERLTLIGSAGGYPPDRVRALPAAHFATLGIRIQRGRPPFEDWFRAPDLPAFRIDTLGGGGRAVRVRAPRAIRMELSGDFTDWTTLPMHAVSGGEWELVLPIAPGTYRVSLRVDGGRWRAPPGLVTVIDEFGAESAVVVVK